jgi:FkbM family methyltransferase
MISYAQSFEDLLLWRALREVKQGFYVDVGAQDPEADSVTRWFYGEGWSGINIEPHPHFHAKLVQARARDVNLACAAGAEPGVATLHLVGNTGLSSLDAATAQGAGTHGHAVTGALSVAVRPLREILAPFAGRDIHFLKIDAEGSERAVLQGMDFARDRPWIVLIEATVPNSPVENSHLWRDVIEAGGYRDVWFDGLNRWFVAAERAPLGALIALPPNPFDRYRRAREVALESALSAAKSAHPSGPAPASAGR